MSKKVKVCVMTSVHPPFNARVFHKQAKSLAAAGYEVVLVVPHERDEVVEGVRIKAVPKASGRVGRMTVTAARVLAAALRERADVYHFHDPELIPAGLFLKAAGKKVIYDVHEYYRMKLASRGALPSVLKRPLGWLFDEFENAAASAFDGVVAVDRVIEDKFGGHAVKVTNFPFFYDIPRQDRQDGDGRITCVYIGAIAKERGIFQMVEAMELLDERFRLVLAGYDHEGNIPKAEKMPGFRKVSWLGNRPWDEAIRLLAGADIGLLLLQPSPSYSLTGEGITKLFEYMMAGLPILGSDFPNIKNIIEMEDCGVTVDPTDPGKIAREIECLAENLGVRRRMGRKGVEAVRKRYNWGVEEKKLLGLYERILSA